MVIKQLLASLTIFLICLLFNTTGLNAAPRAVVNHGDFSAGQVPQGKACEHDFIIKNTGNEPLVLKIGHS